MLVCNLSLNCAFRALDNSRRPSLSSKGPRRRCSASFRYSSILWPEGVVVPDVLQQSTFEFVGFPETAWGVSQKAKRAWINDLPQSSCLTTAARKDFGNVAMVGGEYGCMTLKRLLGFFGL